MKKFLPAFSCATSKIKIQGCISGLVTFRCHRGQRDFEGAQHLAELLNLLQDKDIYILLIHLPLT